MIKRISLLVMAALLVATMAMAGLAGPAFAKKVATGPSDVQGPTDPPGTCTVKAGQGQGSGEIKEQHHGACR